MKIRIITGACYATVLAGFFLLREFVDARLFHVLTYLFLVLGTEELARMLKPYTFKWTYIASIIYAVAFVPAYYVGIKLISGTLGWLLAVDLTFLMLVITSVFSLIFKNSLKTLGLSLLPYVYPSLLLLFMLLANDMNSYGFIVLLLSFVISPLSDTFAYFVGSLIGGKKLCPKISPKKTWSGAIGGTVGGAIGALIVYLIFKPTINICCPALFFIGVGIVASIVNIFGDLFESLVKRKAGVKDSGKILPGHGGVLDRIDGTSFVIVFVYLLFLLV